jgi:hypothetical protein
MADIGRDGTTTVRKLEGFQKGLHAERSYFTASEVPSLDVLKLLAQAGCVPQTDHG